MSTAQLLETMLVTRLVELFCRGVDEILHNISVKMLVAPHDDHHAYISLCAG